MVKILLKIDNENNVTYKANNDKAIKLNEVSSLYGDVPAVNKKQSQRTIDDFMYKNSQYIRAGEVYIEITPQDKMIGISRSKYYNTRKKAHNNAI